MLFFKKLKLKTILTAKRISYWWYNFRTSTLPNVREHLGEWTRNNGIYMWIFYIVAGCGLIAGTWAGFNYARYQHQHRLFVAQKHKAEQMIKVKSIYAEGPEKYLEEQLDCKNKAQVIRQFNASEKWQGRYYQVIQHCNGFTTNKQFQNYLNPIVHQIQTGPLVKQQGINLTFANKPVDLSDDSVIDGVMLVLIDSKNGNQVHAIKELQEKHPHYRLVVYDKQSPKGELNFQGLAKSWLWNGEGLPNGFNAGNDWTGSAYGFNNGQMVFHSHSVKNLPDKLPDDDTNIINKK